MNKRRHSRRANGGQKKNRRGTKNATIQLGGIWGRFLERCRGRFPVKRDDVVREVDF